MRPCGFLLSLLTAALSLSTLIAGDEPRQTTSNDPKKSARLREEEQTRLLTSLANRCKKLLEMQIEVRDATRKLHKDIEASPEKKPRPADLEASHKLTEKAKDIVREASKVIESLEAERTAVAFTEVFQGVCEDMKRVQRCLEKDDFGPATQAVEEEVLEALRDITEALEKSR